MITRTDYDNGVTSCATFSDCEKYRAVFQAARRVLRFWGVDKVELDESIHQLDVACEDVKLMDAGGNCVKPLFIAPQPLNLPSEERKASLWYNPGSGGGGYFSWAAPTKPENWVAFFRAPPAVESSE